MDKEKAEIFHSHLAEVFQPHFDIGNKTVTRNLENLFISQLSLYLAPIPFFPGAIQHFI